MAFQSVVFGCFDGSVCRSWKLTDRFWFCLVVVHFFKKRAGFGSGRPDFHGLTSGWVFKFNFKSGSGRAEILQVEVRLGFEIFISGRVGLRRAEKKSRPEHLYYTILIRYKTFRLITIQWVNVKIVHTFIYQLLSTCLYMYINDENSWQNKLHNFDIDSL